MAYSLYRLAAHLSAPNTYEAPSSAELSEIFDEMTRSREFADQLYLSIEGGGATVTFSQEDIDTISDLRSPSD